MEKGNLFLDIKSFVCLGIRVMLMQKSRAGKWGALFVCSGLLFLPACATSSSGDMARENDELRLAALEERVYSGLEKQEILNQQIETRLAALEAKFPDLKASSRKTVKITPPPPPVTPAATTKEPLAKTSLKSPAPATSAPAPAATAAAKTPTNQAPAAAGPAVTPPAAEAAVAATSTPATVAPAPATSGSGAKPKGDKAVYAAALNLLEKGRPEQGRAAMEKFMAEYPQSSLMPNALYWKGESYYSQKRYEDAIISFKDVTAKYAKSNKAPDALLKIGMSYQKLGDSDNAKFYLQNLLEGYPASRSAALAKKQLAGLK